MIDWGTPVGAKSSRIRRRLYFFVHYRAYGTLRPATVPLLASPWAHAVRPVGFLEHESAFESSDVRYRPLTSSSRPVYFPASFRSLMLTRLHAVVDNIPREERRVCRLRPPRRIVRMTRIVEDSLYPMARATVQGSPLRRQAPTCVAMCTPRVKWGTRGKRRWVYIVVLPKRR